MSNVGIIFGREFRSYFDSAIAYIFLVFFLALNSFWFMRGFFIQGAADMRGFFALLPMFNLFFLPAVSMRLWAEDKRSGTMELLMTLPMRSWQIVTGKYLASVVFYGVALLGTMVIPLMIELIGNPDGGAIVAGYLGSFLLGALYLAIGIFISGLFRDQIAAFIISLVTCLLLLVIGNPDVAGWLDGVIGGLGSFLKDYVGFSEHYEGIQRGVIDVRNVLYFLTMSGAFLVLNTAALEGRRY